jgi:hypothetical protein
MKKIVIGTTVVWAMVVITTFAGDLSNPSAMMAAADKAVGSVSAPRSGEVGAPTGIQVGPGVVAVEAWTFKSSVAKVGLLRTMAAIPSEFPKTFTVASALAVAIPIFANNPKLLGLEKKNEVPAAAFTTTTQPTSVEGIYINVNGNSGSTITVVARPSTNEAKE